MLTTNSIHLSNILRYSYISHAHRSALNNNSKNDCDFINPKGKYDAMLQIVWFTLVNDHITTLEFGRFIAQVEISGLESNNPGQDFDSTNHLNQLTL